MVSFVERQGRVNAACSSLIEIGYCSNLFTVKNLYEHGYTEDYFLEFIKPISCITDLEDYFLEFIKPISCITDLDELRYLSNVTDQFSSWNYFSQFIDHMDWLQNNEEGRKVMKDVRRRILKKKFEKKELSKADVSLARELVDYASSRIQQRKQIDIKISELMKRQMELERENCGGDGGSVDDRNLVAAESGEARNETKIPFLSLLVRGSL